MQKQTKPFSVDMTSIVSYLQKQIYERKKQQQLNIDF